MLIGVIDSENKTYGIINLPIIQDQKFINENQTLSEKICEIKSKIILEEGKFNKDNKEVLDSLKEITQKNITESLKEILENTEYDELIEK